MTHERRKPILIAGPTASGKSNVALQLATRLDGAIINADSMQVYRELHILTARPTAAEEAQAPHLLYGHTGAAESYSVARWIEDVRSALEQVRRDGRRPIIVGGTGLYFKALLEGLSPVPEIPATIRQHWRNLASEQGASRIHAELSKRDPVMAARLAPGDAQRAVRALEVVEATGRSLADWQMMPGSPVIEPDKAIRVVVGRPRHELHQRADSRFEEMLREGAIEEVRALLALRLDPDAPAGRALGVRPIERLIAGEATFDAAAEQGKTETRQYIKRQETWLRRHMIAWNIVQLSHNCVFKPEIIPNIDFD